VLISSLLGGLPAADVSDKPRSRLLLSAKPAVTFPCSEHHRLMAAFHLRIDWDERKKF